MAADSGEPSPSSSSSPDSSGRRVVPATPNALRAEIKRQEDELAAFETPEAAIAREQSRWHHVFASRASYAVWLADVDLPVLRASLEPDRAWLFDPDFLEADGYVFDENQGLWMRTVNLLSD